MEKNDSCHVLIAAGQDRVISKIQSLLPSRIKESDSASSMAKIRQKLALKDYDILIIYSPLTDEPGIIGAIDLALRYPGLGIMLILDNEIYNQALYKAGDTGVMIIPRPISQGGFVSAVEILLSIRKKVKRLLEDNSKLQKKLEDEKYIGRAKCLLIERKGLTEGEAHKYLEQMAMNSSSTKKEVAIRVIRDSGRIVVNGI